MIEIPGLGKRPLIMGILNITPDSFSGDGLMVMPPPTAEIRRSSVIEAVLQQARRMIADGADILDIGGESSRPGSIPVSAEDEIERTAPVVEALHERFPLTPLSIDTVKPDVAKAALDKGACIINDISGTNQNPDMLKLASGTGAYIVLMHNSSQSNAVLQDPRLGSMYEAPASGDIVRDVTEQLNRLAENALKAGIKRERIILDPGLGFGKTVEQNLRLINELDKFAALGFPVLSGPSRKSFIGRTLDLSVEDRLEGTCAAIAISVMRGASILRVHDVKAMARVAKMTQAVIGA